MARIGVFVCRCGTNIAGVVDVPKVVEEVSSLPGVAIAQELKFSCSEKGQAAIQEAIKTHSLDGVVIASCSPRMHENTFMKCAARAGLNPYQFEMANIREQCSWVHTDPEQATRKAFDLTKMAVAKASRLSPLVPKKIPVEKRALVIGGGIAGMQAALNISKAGYPVTIVERDQGIGGRMAQLEKTFPTLDCSA
jgi:heterodisulfide reductase subunit A2